MGDGTWQAARDVSLLPLAVDHAVWRRQVIFQCCKWDPQVGDVSTISDHACLISPEAAAHLNHTAETLAEETMAVEQALASRPELFAELAIPARLRRLLRRPVAGPAVRVMRFDFHPTEAGGWALSEVNSDVPGGFAEASALPVLAARHVREGAPHGDAAGALVAGLLRRAAAGGRVALVHATAYSDDRQVMQYLANRLGEAGFAYVLAAPDHLCWVDGKAVCVAEGEAGPVDAVVRFFPAEWMTQLPANSGWRGYFDARTVQCNPPQALLSQSKRLPLVWEKLGVAVPAWRAALPETRDPREAPWRTDEGWLLKPAFGRVGEDIAWRSDAKPKDWRRIARSATIWPRHWVAQRRFVSRALASGAGPRHLCVGVFVVDGKASGFYGRLAAGEIVDKHAQDVSVLVETAQGGPHGG
jgi:glutathionylspermidine synthase